MRRGRLLVEVERLNRDGNEAEAWRLLQRHDVESSTDPELLIHAARSCADDDRATDMARRAGQLAGANPDVLVRAAGWMYFGGDLTNAWEFALRAQELLEDDLPQDHPLRTEVQFILGAICMHEEEFEAAVELLSLAYRAGPADVGRAGAWAQTLAQTGRVDEAREVIAFATAQGQRDSHLDRAIELLKEYSGIPRA